MNPGEYYLYRYHKERYVFMFCVIREQSHTFLIKELSPPEYRTGLTRLYKTEDALFTESIRCYPTFVGLKE